MPSHSVSDIFHSKWFVNFYTFSFIYFVPRTATLVTVTDIMLGIQVYLIYHNSSFCPDKWHEVRLWLCVLFLQHRTTADCDYIVQRSFPCQRLLMLSGTDWLLGERHEKTCKRASKLVVLHPLYLWITHNLLWICIICS